MDVQINKGFSLARMWRFMTAGIAADRSDLRLNMGVFATGLIVSFYRFKLLPVMN